MRNLILLVVFLLMSWRIMINLKHIFILVNGGGIDSASDNIGKYEAVPENVGYFP